VLIFQSYTSPALEIFNYEGKFVGEKTLFLSVPPFSDTIELTKKQIILRPA
jgi:hypothetical protein